MSATESTLTQDLTQRARDITRRELATYAQRTKRFSKSGAPCSPIGPCRGRRRRARRPRERPPRSGPASRSPRAGSWRRSPPSPAAGPPSAAGPGRGSGPRSRRRGWRGGAAAGGRKGPPAPAPAPRGAPAAPAPRLQERERLGRHPRRVEEPSAQLGQVEQVRRAIQERGIENLGTRGLSAAGGVRGPFLGPRR